MKLKLDQEIGYLDGSHAKSIRLLYVGWNLMIRVSVAYMSFPPCAGIYPSEDGNLKIENIVTFYISHFIYVFHRKCPVSEGFSITTFYDRIQVHDWSSSRGPERPASTVKTSFLCYQSDWSCELHVSVCDCLKRRHRTPTTVPHFSRAPEGAIVARF